MTVAKNILILSGCSKGMQMNANCPLRSPLCALLYWALQSSILMLFSNPSTSPELLTVPSHHMAEQPVVQPAGVEHTHINMVYYHTTL